jgi:dihydrofolate reductase
VSKVIWHITMSLDGFIAGPDDSMDWAVGEWSDDGSNTRDIEVDRSSVADEVMRSTGAILGASTAVSGRGPSSCSHTDHPTTRRTPP